MNTHEKIVAALWKLVLDPASNALYFDADVVAHAAGVSPSTVRKHLEDRRGFGRPEHEVIVHWVTDRSRQYSIRAGALVRRINELENEIDNLRLEMKEEGP